MPKRESEFTNVLEADENSCNLCGSDSNSDFLSAWDWESATPKKFNIVKCNQCGLVYMNPRPKEHDLDSYYSHDYYTHKRYEVPPYYASGKSSNVQQIKLQLRASLYSNFYTSDAANSHSLHRVIGSILFFLLQGRIVTRGRWGILGEKGRLLDVGCGQGKFLFGITHDWLLGKNVDCYGIDVDCKAVENANALGLPVAVADSESLPFPDSHFDIITMKHSLEHVPNPSLTLKEMHRVIKPDGKIIVDVPDIDSLLFRMLNDKWAGIDAPRHLFHFNARTLVEMLERAKFKVIKVHKWRGIVYKEISLRRMRRFWEYQGLPNWRKALTSVFLNVLLFILGRTGSGETISIKAYKPIREF